MSIFNERLQALKEENNLQSKDIAKELNITQSKVSYYMRGGEPSYDLLNSFADLFNVTTDYLTGHSNQRNPKAEIMVDTIKDLAGKETKNKDRVPHVEEHTEVFYNTLVRLSDIELDNNERYNDIWKSIDQWLSSMDSYCDYLQADNDSYPIDEAKKIMDTLTDSAETASERIFEMLKAICFDDTGKVPPEIKKRVIMRSSFGIRSNSKDENK